jgi:glycosyltransferase involved in cell wall biosynthesis
MDGRTHGGREHNNSPVMKDNRRPGLNVVGYVRHELGIGEAARLFVGAAEAAGYDYATVPFLASANRQQGAFRGEDRAPMFDTNVVYINPDQFIRFVEDAPPDFFQDRYTIGAWTWETELFPRHLRRAEEYVDEIWLPSRYAAKSVARGATKPVRVFPHPIVPPKPSSASKAELGLPPGFVFLFCFDFNSVPQRKNPLAVVDAFERAFQPGEGPSLFIKCINSETRPQYSDQLRSRAASRADIRVRDFYLKGEDLAAMMAACDAYISLHRSEGFGLTMAEAMALGKPTIATGYSGNLEFMTASNSWLIPFRLTPVPSGCAPYAAGSSWAEPDIIAAAGAMREVFENRAEAGKRGSQAKQDILRLHSLESRARLLMQLMGRSQRRRRWRRLGQRSLALIAKPKPA